MLRSGKTLQLIHVFDPGPNQRQLSARQYAGLDQYFVTLQQVVAQGCAATIEAQACQPR